MEESETVAGSATGAYAKVVVLHAIYLAILLIIYLGAKEDRSLRLFYFGLGMIYIMFFTIIILTGTSNDHIRSIKFIHLRSRIPLLLSKIGISLFILSMAFALVFQLRIFADIGGLLATALIYMLTYFCPQVAGAMLVALYKQFRER